MPYSKIPPTVPGFDLNKTKCVLFSRDGRLLWRSAAWDGKPLAPLREVEQTRWREYVFVDHVEPLLRWLAEEVPGEPFHFNSCTPTGWVRFTFQKLPLNGDWLCVGDCEVATAPLPAPACLVPDSPHERKTNPDNRPPLGSDPFIP